MQHCITKRVQIKKTDHAAAGCWGCHNFTILSLLFKFDYIRLFYIILSRRKNRNKFDTLSERICIKFQLWNHRHNIIYKTPEFEINFLYGKKRLIIHNMLINSKWISDPTGNVRCFGFLQQMVENGFGTNAWKYKASVYKQV